MLLSQSSHHLSLTRQLLLLASWHQCDLYLCFVKINETLKDVSVILAFFLPMTTKVINFVLEDMIFELIQKKKTTEVSLL
jgi:hypothetical protein